MVGKSPVVAIVGAGFGGLNAAKELRRSPVEIVLFDRRNYHLFQPLLYQVATAGISAADIAYPVRAVFRKQKNLDFHMTEVVDIDLDRRLIKMQDGTLAYDYLILSVGSEANYFGLESVARHGFDLKDLDDAEAIRNHILRMFELSTQTEDARDYEALLTFGVVGGGPTGVECAGALAELIRLVLKKDYPELDVRDVRVIVVEMLDKLLVGFPDELSQAALQALRRKHVEVRLNTAVADYDGKTVRLKNGDTIPARTLIWAAGVRARDLIKRLSVKKGRGGRVVVEPTLQLADYPEVFVIGDAAYLEDEGQPLPMMAPVAIQQARVAARNIQQLVAGKSLEEFEYHDPGSLATIGRNVAVARIGRFKFHGFLAWLVWLAVHLFWLIGFRNRLLVLVNWAWAYLFFESGVRLITPTPEEEKELQAA
ncbi:MAG TPA: NAD(P)/FAD-dependent oxidoreductase [Anaerolineales bacterium]|nr:NAD(P)/FAD-dependent oxidoreductase [Anaerolineales bacterium]